MASKSKKRYLARQYMACKQITQHVPNQRYLARIQKNKEDLTMSKLLSKILVASVRVQNERLTAKSTESVRLFAAEYKRLEVASEVLAHFNGPETCNPVDASRLELSISQAGLNYAALDAAASNMEVLAESEGLPSEKLQAAIAAAKKHYTSAKTAE